MDSKASEDQLGVTEIISSNKFDKNSPTMEPKNIFRPSSPPSTLDNNDGFAPSPITPDSNKESTDLLSAFTSPLTIISSPTATSHSCADSYMNEEDDDEDNSPCTPKEGVFDPFAPGPDNLMLAPLSKIHLEESRTYVARRLNFNSIMKKKDCERNERAIETGFDDDMLLEAVYDNLLEAIISKQAEDMLAELAGGPSHDVLVTPPSAPRVTGIADTCPGAPMKPVKKSRNIDLSLCRRLDFDF